MAYKSQAFEPPGLQGRKTGFKLTRTPRKNADGMEDLKEFWLSDEEEDGGGSKVERQLKLADRESQKKAERRMRNVPQEYPSGGEEEEEETKADEIIRDATELGSPIRPKLATLARSQESPTKFHQEPDLLSPSRKVPGMSGMTKNIALNKKAKRKVFNVYVVSSSGSEEEEEESIPEVTPIPISPQKQKASPLTVAPLQTSVLSRVINSKRRLKMKRGVGEEEESDVDKVGPGSKSESASKSEPSSQKSRKPAKSANGSHSQPTSSSSQPKRRRRSPKKALEPEVPLRHSTRTRVKPLSHWKNEHVQYHTTKENGAYVQQVAGVVRMPDATVSPFKRRRKQKSKTPEVIDLLDEEVEEEEKPKRVRKRQPKRSTSVERKTVEKTVKKTESEESLPIDVDEEPEPEPIESEPQPIPEPVSEPQSEPVEPESEPLQPTPDQGPSGWLERGMLTIPVFEGPGSENQILRTVAWAPGKSKNVNIVRNKEEYFKVKTLFDQDSEFSGAGLLEVPVNSRKAVKANDDTYFIFYVIEGVLEVSLSNSAFVATKGCAFEVPMGNFYQFENKGAKPAMLFFTQSKYVVISNPDEEDDDFD